MTNLPTEHDVAAQVEQEFRSQHPDAPEHLDHSSSEHAHWVEEWNRIHGEVVSRLTDEAFYARYPLGRHLNAHDPADAGYVEFWHDMHEQISGRPGTHDWSGAPPAVAHAGHPGHGEHAGHDGHAGHEPQGEIIPPTAVGADPRGEEELATGYVAYELGILRHWHYALNAFDSVMHSATRDEANPDFAGAVLKLFADKVVGKIVSETGAGQVMEVINTLAAEAGRAKAASVSVALRDFYVGHLDALTALDTQLTNAQQSMPAQARATAARLLTDGDADGYLAFRGSLIRLHDDAKARHDSSTLDSLFDLLSVEWMNQSIKDPRFDVGIMIRIYEADLSVIDFDVRGPDGDKLKDHLSHQKGGVDLWALRVPREIAYYPPGNDPAGWVHVDRENRLINQPAEETRRYREVYDRIKAQGHLMAHA